MIAGVMALVMGCPAPLPLAVEAREVALDDVKPDAGHSSGFPSDVPWIVTIPHPQRAQAALKPLFERLDGPGRLLDGVQARLGNAIGVSPTSNLLWIGAGIAADTPIFVAQRGAANETLVSVGVRDTSRFLNALKGALGKNVATGPRIGAIYSLTNGAVVEALVLAKRGRVVVWFAPQDALAAAALLEQSSTQTGHPLQNASIDAELSKARAEVSDATATEVLHITGGVRAALKLSGTWASLLVPKPFTHAASVVTASPKGLAIFGSALFAPADQQAILQRLAKQGPPSEACGLQDGAALLATFPVGAGLDQALAKDAPLPSADQLKDGAALALYPHPNRNLAASVGNAILGAGSWAFVGKPKDSASVDALRATVRTGGMTETTLNGVTTYVAAPADGNPSKTLRTGVFDDVLVLGLGATSKFDRTLAQRTKNAHRNGCEKKFGAASLSIDGDHLMDLAQRGSVSAFSRVALSIASSIDRAAIRVWPTSEGIRIGATVFPRGRPGSFSP